MITRAAVAATIATASLTPHVTAHAAAEMSCPYSKVCTWSRPHGDGNQAVYSQWDAAGFIDPPVSSVQNQTEDPWCFYAQPLFSTNGDKRRVAPGETVESLGFRAESAHRNDCRPS